MITSEVMNLLNKGDEMFRAAEHEISRHEADGGSLDFFACHHIKLSIVHYLQAYIQSFGIQPPRHVTPDNLYRMCVSMDSKFEELDLRVLDCSCEKTKVVNHCQDLDHIRACFDLAKSSQNLVMELLQ